MPESSQKEMVSKLFAELDVPSKTIERLEAGAVKKYGHKDHLGKYIVDLLNEHAPPGDASSRPHVSGRYRIPDP